MNIQDISDKHERTIVAILYRLQQEKIIESWIDARGYQEFSKTQNYLVGSLDSSVNAYDYVEDVNNNETDDDDYKDSDYEETEEDVTTEVEDEDESESDDENISALSQRVWGLETAVSDIKGMIGTLLSKFTSSSKPLKKLRQTQLSVEI